MDKILDRIIELVDKNENVSSEEKEVIRYGLELIFLRAVFGCLIIAIGIIMGSLPECVLYNLMFILLRSYAGGYHAKTRVRCLVQSVITVIAALAAIRICCVNNFAAVLMAVTAIFCGLAVRRFAPVDTESRQLDNEEIIRFRKRTRIILMIYLIISVLYVFGCKMVSCSAMAAIVVSGILVIAEHRKKARL